MKGMRFFGIFLAVCLCLLFVSGAYSKKPVPPPPPPPSPNVNFHGYAVLYDIDTYGNDCAIVSDGEGEGQYIDRELTGGKPRGDKIEVTYNTDTETLRFFRCFMGKPELPWRSDRRVHFKFDVLSGSEGDGYKANKTVADMLAYNVTDFHDPGIPGSGTRRGTTEDGSSYYIDDDTIHLSVYKYWEGDVDKSGTVFLVDGTDVAEDAEAITLTSFKDLYADLYTGPDDPPAPDYWTSIDGSEGGKEEDPHDHICFRLYEDNQLVFTPIALENGIPVTWLVEPGTADVNLEVWRYNNDTASYDRKVLRNFGQGLPFSLVVSKYPIEGDPRPDSASPAPPRHNTLTSTWGNIKVE